MEDFLSVWRLWETITFIFPKKLSAVEAMSKSKQAFVTWLNAAEVFTSAEWKLMTYKFHRTNNTIWTLQAHVKVKLHRVRLQQHFSLFFMKNYGQRLKTWHHVGNIAVRWYLSRKNKKNKISETKQKASNRLL